MIALSRIEARMKNVDEDRFLSSRFAPKTARDALTVLYGFHYELARIKSTVSDSHLGQIRLTWWRDAIAEIFDGQAVRKHEVAIELKRIIEDFALPHSLFNQMIEGYSTELQDGIGSEESAMVYACQVQRPLFELALAILIPIEVQKMPTHHMDKIAQLWALHIAAKEFPERGSLNEKCEELWNDWKALKPEVPSSHFPAIGHVELIPLYWRNKNQLPTAFAKQWRLFFASLFG